jgi:hypothetical protein
VNEWITAAKAELGLDDLAADTHLLLDMTKDVAHNVARPAAPLTAFLVGYAARAGGGAAAVKEAAARMSALAARWEREE